VTVTAPDPPSWRELLLEEPFRLFFPIGVVAALAGVAPWVLSFAGVQIGMAGYGHGMVQVLGFEMAFAVGFLMTAMPRFLEVPGTRMGELVLGLALCAGTVSALSLQYTVIGQGLFLALSMHLLVFVLRRLRGRGDDPPPYFAFLPIGLLSAILGTALILWPIEVLPRLGVILVEQGVMLSFILAVGSHLGPRLIYGHRGFPETTTPAAHKRLRRLFGVGLLLLFSFPLEAAGFARAGVLLRAVIVTWYLFGVLKMYRTPTQALVHVHLFRLSFLSVAAGLWLAALVPYPNNASMHLMFVGGFGLMTFVVATRVTVGHGGFEELWDSNRMATVAPLMLIALSVPTRLAADALPYFYVELLAAAGILWLAGVALWGLVFVPKLAPWHVAPDD
jgi:uncharacterized protein involved in response to NO